ADFAKMRRQCSDAGDFESCDDVLYFFVADRSGACRNDEARQSFGVSSRVVESDEPATGNADQVESAERQEIRERMQIAGRMPRLRTGCWIGLAATPPAPIESDHAVASLAERVDLRFPAFARPCIRVQ